MQQEENQEDQYKTDPQVLGPGEDNRDLRDNPIADPDRDKNTDPAAVYTTLDSTQQTPEEHRKDQSKDPRKEESKVTDTPARDETGPYDDKGEAQP